MEIKKMKISMKEIYDIITKLSRADKIPLIESEIGLERQVKDQLFEIDQTDPEAEGNKRMELEWWYRKIPELYLIDAYITGEKEIKE